MSIDTLKPDLFLLAHKPLSKQNNLQEINKIFPVRIHFP